MYTLSDITQIQNAVRTATVLARSENEPFGLAHLETVLEVGSAWRASRLDVIDMAHEKERSTLTSIYGTAIVEFALSCWRSWITSVPGSFPEQ